MRHILTIAALALSIFLQSCSDEQQQAFSKISGQLGSLYDLQGVIEEKLEEGDVGVHIQNGTSLTISLVNTEFNDKSKKQRENKSHELTGEIKAYIATHEDLSALKYLFISYVENQNYLIAHFTNTIDYYQFSLEKKKTPSKAK